MFDRTVHHVYEGTVEVHYYIHADQPTTVQLTRIEERQQDMQESVRKLVAQSSRRERVMTVQLDALKSEVEAIPNVVQSVVTLLNGIEARLDAVDAAEDAAVQQQIDNIKSDIHNNIDALAQAVAARTPAEEPPATTPTEPAPGSVPMGGGGMTQPPGQPDTTAGAGTTTPSGVAPPSGGSESGAGGTTGTADTGAPGGGETTPGGNPPA